MNIVEGLTRRPLTVAEVRRMVDAGIIAEDENFELIDGEVVPMPPKGNQHEVIKSALTRVLARLSPDTVRLGVETSIYLDDRTFVEPDLCLYPKRILSEDVLGADVILAIEVAGSTMAYDRDRKAKVYARHGVQEFWVVDTKTRDTWIHRQPQEDGEWGSIERFSSDKPVEPVAFPGLVIRMADLD